MRTKAENEQKVKSNSLIKNTVSYIEYKNKRNKKYIYKNIMYISKSNLSFFFKLTNN